LDEAGLSLREAMQLARHSDPKLTMRVYGKKRLHELGAAVGRLPALLPRGPEGPPPTLPVALPKASPGC
jgi:hypothetical protein